MRLWTVCNLSTAALIVAFYQLLAKVFHNLNCGICGEIHKAPNRAGFISII